MLSNNCVEILHDNDLLTHCTYRFNKKRETSDSNITVARPKIIKSPLKLYRDEYLSSVSSFVNPSINGKIDPTLAKSTHKTTKDEKKTPKMESFC